MDIAREDGSGRYTAVSLHDQKDCIETQTQPLGGHPDDRNQVLDNDHPDKSESILTRLLDAHNGWRRGVIYCILTAFVVLLCVLCFAAWAVGQSTENVGIRMLFQGSCKSSKNISTAAHVAINALSTLLLGASNYCMHIASAPSRRDIDKMHTRKKVLDIGLNSVSNILRLGWDRRFVWVILALSSIPLHLMSNSVIYATTTAYEYSAAVVTDDFFQGANWSMNALEIFYGKPWPAEWYEWLEHAQTGDLQLTKLDNKACVEEYAKPFVTQWGNVLLTANRDDPNTIMDYKSSLLTVMEGVYNDSGTGSAPSYAWLCSKGDFETGYGSLPSCSSISANASTFMMKLLLPLKYFPEDHNYGWNYRTVPISGCFAQKLDEKCTVETTLSLLGVIVAFIVCKVLCMIWVFWRLKESPLAVVGDAVASFIEEPDENTKGACLGAASDFCRTKSWQKTLKWSSKANRWSQNVSGGQWTACVLLCITALCIAFYLFGKALSDFGENSIPIGSAIIGSGFNTIHPAFMLFSVIRNTGNGISSLLPAVLLANLPQLIVSFIYVSYNSVWTSMLMGLEWSQYAHVRRTLRVSYPDALQRSTYRLQIPYRYGIPLMVLIGSIHLLISESIYVVRIKVLTQAGQEDPYQSFVTCGYSLLALLVTIIVGIGALLGVIGFGFRKYKPGMPLVKCSSAAISAACHPRPDEDTDAALRPLQWGAVPTDNDLGHCCFSTGLVVMPIEGLQYA